MPNIRRQIGVGSQPQRVGSRDHLEDISARFGSEDHFTMDGADVGSILGSGTSYDITRHGRKEVASAARMHVYNDGSDDSITIIMLFAPSSACYDASVFAGSLLRLWHRHSP